MFLLNIDTAQLTTVYMKSLEYEENQWQGYIVDYIAFANLLWFQEHTCVNTFNYVKVDIFLYWAAF